MLDPKKGTSYIINNQDVGKAFSEAVGTITELTPVFLTGFTNVPATPVKIFLEVMGNGRKRITLEGRIQPNTGNFTNNFNADVLTLPTGTVPTVTQVMSGVPNAGSSSVVGVVADKAGTLRITVRGNTTSTVSISGLSYII